MGSTCCANIRTEANTNKILLQNDALLSYQLKKERLSSTTATKISSECLIRTIKQPISKLYKREGEIVENEALYSRFYQARHIASKVPLLLREIKKITLGKILDVGEFISKIALQKEFDHPNIAKMFEVLEDELNYYIIYEDLKGDFLSEYRHNHNDFNVIDISIIGRCIASVLDYLHKQGVYAGLICPDNFIFGTNSRMNTVKLLDFTFAGRFAILENRLKFSTCLNYCAPEAIKNRRNTKASDVWAFGKLMQSLLLGEERAIKSACQLGDENASASNNLNKNSTNSATKSLLGIIQNCIALAPESRPKIADLLANDALQKSFENDLNEKLLLLKKIKINQYHGAFYQSILEFIITRVIDFSQKKEAISLFQSLDTNCNGTITKQDFSAAYSKSQNDTIAAEKEVSRIFFSLNANRREKITLSEFLSITLDKEKLLSEENLVVAFKLLDFNGFGQLTQENLIMQLRPQIFSDDDWEDLLHQTGATDLGSITYKNFEKLFLIK